MSVYWNEITISKLYLYLHVHCCSSQQSRHGNNLGVHWQMNGQRTWGIFVEWTIIYPCKRNLAICDKWIDIEVILLSEMSQGKKNKCLPAVFFGLKRGFRVLMSYTLPLLLLLFLCLYLNWHMGLFPCQMSQWKWNYTFIGADSINVALN